MPEQSRRRSTAEAKAENAKPAADEAPEAPKEEAAEEESPKRSRGKQDDPRIGQSVPAHWDSVGYDDGSQYRCEDGVIVERTN